MYYKMMKKIILLFALLSLNTYAQEIIQTARPGQSIGPAIVPVGRYQIQSGLEYNEFKLNGEPKSTNLINNNVFRTGIREDIELSAVLDISELNSSEMQTQNFQFGGRINLIQTNLKMSFQTRAQIINASARTNKKVRVVNILVTVYGLGEYGSLTNNLIFSNLNDDDDFFNGYTLAWGINLNDKWNTFVEYYGSKNDDDWVGAWDTGFGYLVHNDLLLDFSFGQDLDSDISSQFISFGFSYRI